MSDIMASGATGANGCRLDWTLDFDDAANTVTIDATHKHFDGSPAPDPQQAQITLELASGQSISVNLLTARLGTGQLFDGNAVTMINAGPRVRSGVTLRVSPRRAASIGFSTQYTPPAE